MRTSSFDMSELDIFNHNNTPKTKLIQLSLSEIDMAIAAGVLRRKECIRGGFQNIGYGKTKAGVWDADIEGAGAEFAFCRYKNLYCNGVINNFKAADVLLNVQVRHTPLDNGRLIFRDDDNPSEYYVSVTGRIPYMKIRGFMLGKDTMRDEWLYGPNGEKPAWFVPQNSLKDVDLLDCTSKMASERH